MRLFETSFLALLIEKEAMVRKTQDHAGINADAAIREVERQTRQILKNGESGVIFGDGITKSGDED